MVGNTTVEVEDHGNGYMVVGVTWDGFGKTAHEVLSDYVDNIEDYRFACPAHYGGRSAVWLTTEPGNAWYTG